MSASHLTITELADKVRRKPQTIRLHIKARRLPAEKIPGARGWRVTSTDARKWAGRYLGLDLNQ